MGKLKNDEVKDEITNFFRIMRNIKGHQILIQHIIGKYNKI